MVFSSRVYLVLIVTFILQLNSSEAQEINNQSLGRNNTLERDTADINSILTKARRLEMKYTDSAVTLLKYAYYKSRDIGFAAGVAKALINTGKIYYHQGKIEKSRNLFQTALFYATYTGVEQSSISWNCYNNIAATYHITGKYDSAIYYYHMALQQSEKGSIRDTTASIHLYANLASIFIFLKQYNKAEYYLETGARLANTGTYKKDAGALYINFSTYYSNRSKFDLALAYAEKTLIILREHQNDVLKQNAWYTMGRAYTQLGKHVAAIAYFDSALSLRTPDLMNGVIKPALGIGTTYGMLRNYDKAEHYFLMALDAAGKMKLREKVMSDILSSLAQLYGVMGRYKDAYFYRSDAASLKDSLLNADRVRTFADMEAKYQAAEKNRELAEKQLQITKKESQIRQKNLWIGGVSISSLLFAIALVNAVRSNKHKQKLQNEQLQTMKQEQEIGNLKAMVKGEEKERTRLAQELHDGIVSQLLGIKLKISLLHSNKTKMIHPDELGDILGQMDDTTKDLRKTAHNMLPDILMQNGLPATLAFFCDKTETNSGVEIDFQEYGPIPRFDQEIELPLYRMVQELVQNALKHSKATQILVQISYRNEILGITVEDNGIGFDPTQQQNENSGLKIIESRVQMLNGNIDLISSPDTGTIINLEFHLQAEQRP